MTHSARLVVALPALDDVLAGRLECPNGLRRLLTRGRIEKQGGDAALADALRVDALPAAGPRAALAAGDRPAPDSTWLRVDPVHLQPDLTAVWLRSPAALDWSAESMAPLHAALDSMFDADDLDWRRPRSDRPGRLGLRPPTEASFTPLHAAVGGRLDEILPRGPDAARWHGLINEAQMTFHQFRALDDANPAGLGLWFWGAGRLPAAPDEHPVARVVAAGDRAEGEGLARWFRREAEAADAAFRSLPGVTLVEASLGPDTPARLPALDAEWFEPAWRALRAGRLRGISVVGHAHGVHAGRWSPFAFWRHGRLGEVS